MKKVNKRTIILSLEILAFLAFLIPLPAMAEYYGTYSGYNTPSAVQPITQVNVQTNPRPTISSINPNSLNRGIGTKTITITGSGFVPGSVAKINGANRPTTFIDYSHIFVQANSSDLSRTDGGFYITVMNGAPGGGFSNAVLFKVNYVAAPVTTTNTNNTSTTYSANTNYTSDTYQDTYQESPTNDTGSALASNVVFGSNSFLPSGLIQWIMFAIIILLVVILVRKIFGAEENYHAAPLKHD